MGILETMKELLFISVLALLNTAIFAQEDTVSEPVENPNLLIPIEEIAFSSDVEPKFPGGEKVMMEWISDQIKYPEEAKKERIEGSVYVRFIVEKDGSLSHIRILRSPHDDMSNEVIRIINEMPKWIPGKTNGKIVRVIHTLPIQFIL